VEPARYFYSTNGADSHGPVTLDALRVLYQNGVIGAGSFLLREGQTEWRPFMVDAFQRAVSASRPPPYSPPPYTPDPESAERMRELTTRSFQWEEESRVPEIAMWLGRAVLLGTAIYLSLIAPPPGGASIAYRLGNFCGHLLGIYAFPYIISGFFLGFRRRMVRTSGIIIVAALVIVSEKHQAAMLQLETVILGMKQHTQEEARREIAEKGYYTGNMDEAEANLQKLEAEAQQDDNEASRLVLGTIPVSRTILEKIKAAEAASQACGDLDPSKYNSLDDVTAAKAAVTQLRNAENSVLDDYLNYDDHLRAALAGANVSDKEVNQFIEGAHQGGNIDQMVVLWRLKITVCDDQLARLDFLEKNWGAWNAKDGRILFPDDANAVAYKQLVHAIQKDANDLKEMQLTIYR